MVVLAVNGVCVYYYYILCTYIASIMVNIVAYENKSDIQFRWLPCSSVADNVMSVLLMASCIFFNKYRNNCISAAFYCAAPALRHSAAAVAL
jgi:hypothetical protein